MPPRNQVDAKRVLELARAGMAARAIARRLAISVGSVHRVKVTEKRRAAK